MSKSKYSVVALRTLDELEREIIDAAKVNGRDIADLIKTNTVLSCIDRERRKLKAAPESFRGRKDFLANLQAASVHVMIMLDDIQYPLSSNHQKWLENVSAVLSNISRRFMEEDLQKVAENLKEDEHDDN